MSNGNNIVICEIYSKLIKTPERSTGVVIVGFIFHILMFPLLTLDK